LLVMAIGQNKKTNLVNNILGVDLDHQGCIRVSPLTGQTGNPKIFAAGDCVSGGKEVVTAVANAKITANKILKYLNKSSEYQS